MGEFRTRSLKHLEKIMKRKPDKAAGDIPPRRCQDCMYYQPRFRYRKCFYTKCKFGLTDRQIFRDKPVPVKYTVMRKKVN